MPANTADLQVGVTYAIAFESDPMWALAHHLPPASSRPVQAWWSPQLQLFTYIDPERPSLVLHEQPEKVSVLGEWNDRLPDSLLAHGGMTWAGLAAHALGQVLRQQEIVRRLKLAGIERTPESYIYRDTMPNSVELSLILNFDELNQLLDRAGV